MSIVLNEKQQKGLEIAVARYKAGERYTVISGYAGSGKSTLVKFIVSALGFENVAYATPTGKAALVLRQMGNKDAQTIHKTLYEWRPMKNGGFFRSPVEFLPPLVVCDEVSMIDQDMINELLSHHETYVIFTGDPGQIEPVDKNKMNHLLDEPHIFLDEIMRQAAESRIIQLSMAVRNHQSIDFTTSGDAMVIHPYQITDDMYLWADEIIVAKNATRQTINNKMVKLLGFTEPIQDGMKVICTRNDWNFLSDIKEPIVNGSIGIIHNVEEKMLELPERFGIRPFPIIECDFETEACGTYKHITFDKNELLTGRPVLHDWKTLFNLKQFLRSKGASKLGIVLPQNGELGYAITGHKSQGSQWPKVLVIEEDFPYEDDSHTRWVYTGITRAQDKLVFAKR